jgi:hypothetical protein
MTVATQLRAAHKKRPSYQGRNFAQMNEITDGTTGVVSPDEAVQPNPYHRNDREIEHRGFNIKRSGDYQLWYVTQNGEPVAGMLGAFSRLEIARGRIDDFLDKNILNKENDQWLNNTNKEQSNT